MQNIKPMKRRLARYQLYGVLVAAKSQQPIDILYCIDCSSYSDWKIANGFLIDPESFTKSPMMISKETMAQITGADRAGVG
jgi:hypothetical protein